MENKDIHKEFDVTDVEAEMAAQAANKPAKFPEGTGDIPLLDSDLLEEEGDEEVKLDEKDMLDVKDEE